MVSGEKIIILLEEDKSFAESGPDQRVEVILFPKGEQRPRKEKP
jgi:lipopolysaccharide export system protein LptA